jgi:hypothetical protein
MNPMKITVSRPRGHVHKMVGLRRPFQYSQNVVRLLELMALHQGLFARAGGLIGERIV